jgi:Reverse transcriptase (RNA-dependent DNA polymerase).
LNNVTIGDTYPLPNKQEILDKLGNARYYSALDCASGYWQIALREQAKPKTAFSVLGNHYEFNRMSFGLKSAPATYQRMMNTVLYNVLGERSFVYLYDVIVFGRTSKEHNE